MKIFFKQVSKISALYLKKQKSFIPKKIWPKPRVNWIQYQNNQLCLLTQFSVTFLDQSMSFRYNNINNAASFKNFSLKNQNAVIQLRITSSKPYWTRSTIMENINSLIFKLVVKFIYSEKATKLCKIFTLLLTVCTVVKSKVKISQNCVAFSEYMNFTIL